MRGLSSSLRTVLALWLCLAVSCTSVPKAGRSPGGALHVTARSHPDGRVEISFPPPPSTEASRGFGIEEARAVLSAFQRAFPPAERAHLRRLLASTKLVATGDVMPTDWELRLRQEFLARLGSSPLPLPPSLEGSPLFVALQLSPRYMGAGVREAAEEMFRSPAFLASITLAMAVYLAAWALPEPVFSKAFATALTVRLALAVGVLELVHLGKACLRLYQEAMAARTDEALEAAAEHFGRAVGGTALRVLVLVASFGVAKVLPAVPEGGLGPLLGAPRYAVAEGMLLGAGATAQVTAHGTLVVAGAALGTVVSPVCGGTAVCSAQGGPGSAGVSTRYGGPHTRRNVPHNETIENELARREAAGHIDLRKNQAQVNAQGRQVQDPAPVGGVRFRKPDASSLRPDGIRHNTNYVSNPRDLQRELDAFEAMVRADQKAIHELYQLDGTLVRRYVPPGVSLP
jgi:hypothetical protein